MDGDKTGGACHPHEEQWCSHTYATAIRRKNKVFVVDMIKKKSKSYSKPLGCHGKKTPFFFLFSKNPALFISKCWERRGDNKRRLIEWWPFYIYIYVCVENDFFFSVLGFCKSKGDFHVATTRAVSSFYCPRSFMPAYPFNMTEERQKKKINKINITSIFQGFLFSLSRWRNKKMQLTRANEGKLIGYRLFFRRWTVVGYK